MHRAQIYINEQEYDMLRKDAFDKRCSISELVRSIIDNKYLKPETKKISNLKNIVGFFKDNKKDIAKRHDLYLNEK